MITRTLKEVSHMIHSEMLDSKYSDAVISGISIDSRSSAKGNLFIPIKGENTNGHKYIDNAISNGCVATLWDKNEPNPPTTIGCILVDDTVEAFQQLAISYRHALKATFIGITGSNGKTSTKDILAGILSVKYKTQKTLGNHNNELGVPMTILSLDEDCQMAVIEMGIESPGELMFLKPMVDPHIGILTSIGPIHIENFDNIEGIVKEKLQMTNCLCDNGLFVYNGDIKLIKTEMSEMTLNPTLRLKTFGEHSSNDLYCKVNKSDEEGVEFSTFGEIISNFKTPLLGKHQAFNCLSSILVALSLGFTTEEIQEGLYNVDATGLRNEIIKIGNATILNDSYKSNPQSLLAALDILKTLDYPKKIAVLGDMVGLGENYVRLHNEIGEKLTEFGVDELITFGDLGKLIGDGAQGKVPNVVNFYDKAEAAKYISKYINENCAMLFKASRAVKLEEIIEKIKELI